MSQNKRPKAILFDLRHSWYYHIFDILYRVLNNVFDLTIVGPGHIPYSELEEDALKTYEKLGPFDAAFITRDIYFNLTMAGWTEDFATSVKSYYNVKKFLKEFPNFGKNFDKIPCHKFLNIIMDDTYSFLPQARENCENFPGHLIATPKQTILPLAKLPDYEKENFSYQPTDEYYKLCQRHDDRIIPFLDIVGHDEFDILSLSQKKYLACVPGALYLYRKLAFDAASNAHLDPVNRLTSVKVLQKLSAKLNFPMYRSHYGIRYYQKAYRDMIKKSLVTYADGSRFRIGCSKHYEIPSYGSMLAGESFVDGENFGFVNGKTMIECEPHEFPDVVLKAQNNPEWAMNITKNGQDMIRQFHTVKAHSNYLQQAWDAIKEEKYCGAKWIKGKFTLNKPTKP